MSNNNHTEKVSFSADIKRITINGYLGSCHILKSDEPSKIKIETEFLDKDSIDDYKITFQNQNLLLESKNKNACISTVNGQTFISSGGGISIINGVVYGGQPAKQPPKTTLYIPSGLDLHVSGILKEVKSQVTHQSVNLDLSAQTKVTLSKVSKEIIGEMSGQTSFSCSKAKSIALNLQLSGQSSYNINGSFQFVKIKTSGQSRASTSGECKGNYDAKSSGQSTITHSGSILGFKNKDSSGQSSIRI
jgi:hypothetical protein